MPSLSNNIQEGFPHFRDMDIPILNHITGLDNQRSSPDTIDCILKRFKFFKDIICHP